MGYFQVRYDSRVVNYECKLFIRLATGLPPLAMNKCYIYLRGQMSLHLLSWILLWHSKFRQLISFAVFVLGSKSSWAWRLRRSRWCRRRCRWAACCRRSLTSTEQRRNGRRKWIGRRRAWRGSANNFFNEWYLNYIKFIDDFESKMASTNEWNLLGWMKRIWITFFWKNEVWKKFYERR